MSLSAGGAAGPNAHASSFLEQQFLLEMPAAKCLGSLGAEDNGTLLWRTETHAPVSGGRKSTARVWAGLGSPEAQVSHGALAWPSLCARARWPSLSLLTSLLIRAPPMTLFNLNVPPRGLIS